MKNKSDPTDIQDGTLTEPQTDAESSRKPSGFPLTFSGVAFFASTGWGRLFFWQSVVAAAVAGSLMLLFGQHWSPVLNSAIEQLPEEGGLTEGRLEWPENHTGTLAGNQFLSVIIDLKGSQPHGQTADLQIELREGSWVAGSILGYLEFPYAIDTFEVDRITQIPWWGSRRPFLLICTSCIIGLSYCVISLFLGLIGCWASKTVAFFASRQSDTTSLWRLSTAAWLPSGALLSMGCLCYALGLLPLMGLLVLIPVCLVVGWAYVLFSPLLLPRLVDSGNNPFNPLDEHKDLNPGNLPNKPDMTKSDNPFV
mgnify:CR=1 FL=1